MGFLFSVQVYALKYRIKIWFIFITEYRHPLNSVLRWVYPPLGPALSTHTHTHHLSWCSPLPPNYLPNHSFPSIPTAPGPVHFCIIPFLHSYNSPLFGPLISRTTSFHIADSTFHTVWGLPGPTVRNSSLNWPQPRFSPSPLPDSWNVPSTLPLWCPAPKI